jgi:hypothetical protein
VCIRKTRFFVAHMVLQLHQCTPCGIRRGVAVCTMTLL